MQSKTLFIISAAIVGGFILSASPIYAHHRPPVTVTIINGDEQENTTFEMHSNNDAGGQSVAVADLGDDGVPEIIVGNGLGNEPRVSVRRGDGSEINSFLAYAPNLGVGINVAACDLDGNGTTEIITAPQRGGGPQIRIFDAAGEPLMNGTYFAYMEAFRGGVNIACGDLNNDGKAELATMPSVGGGPHVRIWKMENGKVEMSNEFFAFGADDRRGLVGTVSDGKLIIASQRTSATTVQTYVIHSSPTKISEMNFDTQSTGITSVFAKDGKIQIATASGSNIIDTTTGEKIKIESPFDSIAANSGDFNRDGKDEIVAVASKPLFNPAHAEDDKAIVVDLSQQRFYAYEFGILTNTFLVSTARYPYITPVGNHSVLAKIYEVHYAWSYGAGNANNYDLGWVPYNLRIYPHVYIHYAPWHNNFGHTMSHGCINVALENIQWAYNWARQGIPVDVVE